MQFWSEPQLQVRLQSGHWADRKPPSELCDFKRDVQRTSVFTARYSQCLKQTYTQVPAVLTIRETGKPGEKVIVSA